MEIFCAHMLYYFTFFLCVISTFLIIWQFKKRYSQKCNKINVQGIPGNEMRNSYTLCNSLECVRCVGGHSTLQMALTRLSYFADNDPSVKKYDVESLLLDLQKSLALIKMKEENMEINTLSSSNISSSTPVVFKMSGLREKTFWLKNNFPALQILDKYFHQIYSEFINVYNSSEKEIQCLWKTNSSASGKWSILHIFDQGKPTKVAELCPFTYDVLTKIPYFMNGNIFANAAFSVVHPNTLIEKHCGSTNCRIRCHLGLKVPKDECILNVGGESCFHEEAKMICFNDAFPHSVQHKGQNESHIRVVFMFDMWHPDITDSQKKILNYAFSA